MRFVNRSTLLALSAVMGCAQAVHAQAINKCTINGRLVFQASPCPLEARPDVPPAAVAASVANPGAPKKKTLADVLRERDGGIRNQPVTREAQGDGANVLRSRMGAV